MTKHALVISLVLVAGCARDQPPSVAVAAGAEDCQRPFIGIEQSEATLEDRQILQEASDDFCAILAGNEPVHAKPRPGTDAPSDGGTRFYVARKYKLTALRSASSFGQFFGQARGPIITFDKSFAPGNTSEISSVRVYVTPSAP